MTVKHLISVKTKNMRHAIARAIAPRLVLNGEPNGARPSIDFMKQHFGRQKVVGAEVGVRAGLNSLNIFQKLNVTKLHLIDSYEPYSMLNGRFCDAKMQKQYFEHAKNMLQSYQNNIEWHLCRSDKAIDFIDDNSLDFVYIDGCHEYLVVKADIENFFKKVKPNGVLSGHDFCGNFLGVVTAVMEFTVKQNLELQTANIDWWVKKRKTPHEG